jgi:glycosyltransferase involved in cell wall biosynthesis
MKTAPSVSVLLCFFNAVKYIGEAIRSVAEQTYGDWELLLIDDGSTDGSTEIALSYARLDSGRIRYFEHSGHQNRGLVTSRNAGLHAARAEIVAVLDADDVWFPAKLEEQMSIVAANPKAAMVYGRSQYWCSWRHTPEDVARDTVPELGVESDRLYLPTTLLRHFLSAKCRCPCPSDIIFKRAAIASLGGFEEVDARARGAFEDHALFVKISLALPIFVAGNIWDNYRIHDESMSASYRTEHGSRVVRGFYLQWLRRYLAAHGVADSAIRQRIRLGQLACRFPVLAGLAKAGICLAHAEGSTPLRRR